MASEKIPFVSLCTSEKREKLDSIFERTRLMFESSAFILGEEVAKFEAAFAPLAGCPFAIGVNSGFDALLLSLKSAGIGAGDEVITAPNSFIASAGAIAIAGARPVYADVADDFNLDPRRVEAALTPRTKAILAVHLTGNPCDMQGLQALAQEHNLCLIEDAAQAVGATFHGKKVGSLGDFGCFSLHPLKNLHVWGDGGVVTVATEGKARDLRMRRNHGLKNRDEAEFFSYNSRLDTFQAIVGSEFLPLLDGVTRKRRRNATRYEERLRELNPSIQLPQYDAQKCEPVFHVYQIRARRRDELKAFLAAREIETKIHYPLPLHLHPASQSLGYRRGDFPVTERLANEILSLPVRENLTEEEIDRICAAITHFYKN